MKRGNNHSISGGPDGFTLIELLVVIGIIGILAALTTGLVGSAKRKAVEARVQGELAFLETAIEDYKAAIGIYPPDHVVEGGGVNPFVNQLYYELNGVIANNQQGFYRLPGENVSQRFTEADIRPIFNTAGFANVAEREEDLKYSVPELDQAMVTDLSNTKYKSKLRVLQVPVPWRNHREIPGEFESPLIYHEGGAAVNPLGTGSRINTWRYVSTNPTNNPASYDLWAEVLIGDEVKIIGNWGEEQP